MRYFVFAVFLLTACGGSLTDEQRKKLRAGMKKNEIHKISDAQITDAAFTLARAMAQFTGAKKDSLLTSNSIVWKELREGDGRLTEIERRMVEAYVSAGAEGSDNIQKIGKDSLLYTKPVTGELPDGSRKFKYALGIRMSKKQVILSMSR